jgi:hypothetical protein
MNTLKMLPWLASTAGVGIERAAQLWQSATARARCVTGDKTGHRFFSFAHRRLVVLVEKEVLATHPIEQVPWLMIQAHLSVAPMIVANSVTQFVAGVRERLQRWSKATEPTKDSSNCCTADGGQCSGKHQACAC